MFPAKFAYVRAGSLEEAAHLLQAGEGDSKILAGGHSLLPLMKLRLAQPSTLIDIGRIPDLGYVRLEEGPDGPQVAVGALATYRDLQRSDVVRQRAPVLAEAADQIADVQVRARGTVVGSLAHADPAGDMPAVFLALGGAVHTVGPGGAGRAIASESFFVDMLTTALEEVEIIREVRVNALRAGEGAAYEKFEQPASHYALTGVCAVVRVEGDTIREARIGITGVGPKAYRPERVEQALAGQPATQEAVEAAAQSAADGVDVQGDIHASPTYRAHLARVLTRRAVMRAIERARG